MEHSNWRVGSPLLSGINGAATCFEIIDKSTKLATMYLNCEEKLKRILFNLWRGTEDAKKVPV